MCVCVYLCAHINFTKKKFEAFLTRFIYIYIKIKVYIYKYIFSYTLCVRVCVFACVHFRFTEKLIDAFLTGTIPLYWGCPTIGEFFDMDGILLFDNVDVLVDLVSIHMCALSLSRFLLLSHIHTPSLSLSLSLAHSLSF